MSANQFGELVADPETNELLHYTEKSDFSEYTVLIICCLVSSYIFHSETYVSYLAFRLFWHKVMSWLNRYVTTPIINNSISISVLISRFSNFLQMLI
jgi:hypothetical protein